MWVDELFEFRPVVLVAGLYEERADLDECGAFLGIKSGGFRVEHDVRVERLVEWFDAAWIVAADVTVPIHEVSFRLGFRLA